MERISSRQNAIVKRFRDLARSSRGSARADHTVATVTTDILLDGEHLVQEALASNIPIEMAAFSDRQLADPRSPIARIAIEVQQRGGRVLSVGDHVLAAMSPVQHPSGVVAIASASPADVRLAMSAAADPPLVLVLAGVQDPGNVGAIVRAAAAFGASSVVALDGSANPVGWKALRGAMGGTFRLPVASRATLPQVMAAAQEYHVRLVAAVPRGGTPLPSLDLRPPTAILFGAEGAGLPPTAMTAVGETVTIPMRKPVESLNVAVASALVLYEAMRQREA